jgi:hypothetical protein
MDPVFWVKRLAASIWYRERTARLLPALCSLAAIVSSAISRDQIASALKS